MNDDNKKKSLNIIAAICLSLLGIFLIAVIILLYYRKFEPSQMSADSNASETVVSINEESAESTEERPTDPDSSSAEDIVPEPEPTPEPFEEYDISLMALGDNLMHMGIVNTGRNADKTYNYDFLFQNMKDFLKEADIKVINQETILGGNQLGFHGFPYFNSPTEVGDAIAAAGFNIVLHASNHAADQSFAGIKNCVEFWQQYPQVLMTGINTTDYSQNGSYFETDNTTSDYSIYNIDDIPIMVIKGFKFAVLNYSYSPNTETIPSSVMGHLNILCDYDETTGRLNFTKLNEKVIEDITKARDLADIVLVFPHWGTEYQKVPSSYQKQFALQMTEAGADVIIGTHPHVPQPVEEITAENGNQSLCFYSLGNYVSTQKETLCMLEGMAWINFHVTENGIGLSYENTGVIPLVCHYTSGPVRLENVYLLEEYTEEKALSHGIKGYGGITLHLDTLQNYADEIFGSYQLKKADVLHIDPFDP